MHIVGYASGPKTVTLLTNASAVPSYAAAGNPTWHGGDGMFHAVGTFNGAVLTLNFIGDDGTTLVPLCSVSANATAVGFTCSEGKKLALSLTGSPTGLYASATQT